MIQTSNQELTRKIYLNDRHKNSHLKYPGNKVKTSKYNLWTFIPKCLYLQFMRVANLYFLMIAVLANTTSISSVSPITSVIPLVFVLATSLVREALEDYGRHKNDKCTNNQKVLVNRHHKNNEEEYTEKLWKEIHVGDIIKIQNNQEIPADVVLLDSNDENGLAYVETANLDGEKNLKLKQSKTEIRELIQKVGIDNIKGQMLAEKPNCKIHRFRGIAEIEGLEAIYFNYSNLLLRGTFLKNTTYALGLVVYTGHDTKLMKNQGACRNKKSHIEKQLNKYIFGVFIVQLIMCLLLTLLAISHKDSGYVLTSSEGSTANTPKIAYLFPDYQQQYGAFVGGLVTFASFIMLLNTMIPISLMVSLELAKFFQTKGIEFDELMWDGTTKSKVLNMLIHEDLAKVEYIFADKTGTLTTNEMRFTYCSVNGTMYSKDNLLQMAKISSASCKSRESTPKNNKKIPKEIQLFDLFWLAISLCHEVIIDQRHLNNPNLREKYQGSSPDEVELVSMAAEINYIFSEKRAQVFRLNLNGEIKDFTLISKIDFNSDRKRMSVIMRDMQTEKLFLFCKGADSIMMKRLSLDDNHLEVVEKTKTDLHTFSTEGLRTLVIAYKELDEERFNEWNAKYSAAQLEEFNVLDANSADPAEKLRQLEDEMEKDLILLGATGLEDKLQEGVADTILDLHKAGIKIWMLTGDKLETAENIGYATNLIAKDTKVFKVKTHDIESTLERYQKIKEKIDVSRETANGGVVETKTDIKSENELNDDESVYSGQPKQYKSFALIIDGEAIGHTFHNDKLKNIFLDLIPQFRTVICCRSTPNQKADVVTFVKTNLKKMTLAIGDGGNDVNMIQKADIGVGIFGKEGHQAAFASDYAFSKFFFLWRLLLVHGRWSYLRTSNFINFFVYKNLVFTLPQFYFSMYNGFSAQSLYDSVYLTNYNTFFTSVAPVYYAAQEQDINPRETEKIRKAMPYVYAEFRRKNLFSARKFLFWCFMAVAHSLLIFYSTQSSFTSIANSDGMMFELWEQSISAVTGVFCSVFVLIIMGTTRFSPVTFFCYIVCTLLVFFPGGTVVTDQISQNVEDLLGPILLNGKFWANLLWTTTVCGFIAYIPKMYTSFFNPSLVDLLQRDKKQNKKEISAEMKSKIELVIKSESKDAFDLKNFDFNANVMMKSWYHYHCCQGEVATVEESVPVDVRPVVIAIQAVQV